jgi:hypothetical protein
MPRRRVRTIPDSPAPPSSVLAALFRLDHARVQAGALELDPRDIGLDVGDLINMGLTAADIKLIVDDRLAVVFDGRAKRRRPGLTPTSQFVLARAGEVALADWAGFAVSTIKPRWDAGRRELWYGERRVKRLDSKASNQATVLAAFEEEGWPPRIDDPLPMVDGMDPQERLHETVKRLNREQTESVLTFHRDGSGQGVSWRPSVGEVIVLTPPTPVLVAV